MINNFIYDDVIVRNRQQFHQSEAKYICHKYESNDVK